MPAVPTRGVPLSTPLSPEGPAVGRLRQTLPDAWKMIRPYWFSEDRWPARGLLLVVVALTLGLVYLSVLLNQWNNDFFSALQAKNSVMFREQLIRVGWLVGVFIVLAVYQLYLNQMLEIRWRRWLTERYLRAWLADGAYYRMQLVAHETDNPDQRIAEDIQLLISHALALFIGGLRAVVTLATFVAILWGLSGRLTVSVGGLSLVLPGYMVWVSLLYALGGTWLTDWIGRPLVCLNFDRQRYEADFRFSLVRFRENSEGVALYHGEADEFRGFRKLFGAVVRNWWGIMRRQKRLTFFTSGYSQGAWIVPSVVAAPRYFRGELGLGGLMQTVGAFNQVQDALSFFVVSYKEIAAWCSVVERLAGFERTVQRVRVDDATLREALEAVGLADLAGRLDEAGHWALQLSPGEQQRIAFARALVQKPDWLFLDEATSAVDEATEGRLYQLVRERLAGATVFSVGHRATLRPFHARRLEMQPAPSGPASVVEVTAAPESDPR